MVNRKTWMASLASFVVATALLSAQGPVAEPANAKTWVGKAAEYEEYIRTAPIVKTQPLSIGVTKSERAFFAPGGLVESAAWKTLRPGMRNGFFESYKSEIAAYELDKLLELNMVPPKVERKVDGDVGVAIMWISGTKSFKDSNGAPRVPPVNQPAWNAQLTRAKMYHNLIGDIDPNLGNWLYDPAWNLILIDHSRALTRTKTLVHKMLAKDEALWTRMMAFTEESLTADVGKWLGPDEIKALLERRAKMKVEFDKLSKTR
jgi:hypothetical protein